MQRILMYYALMKLLTEPRVVQRIIAGGGTAYTNAEAIAAIEGESGLNLSGFLDLPEITPPSNPPADTLRLYVEDFKGFPFFSFRDTTGMVRKLVRDSVFVGKNVTGTAIPAFRAVYAIGSVDGVPSIAKARANNIATMPCIGVTLEAIADGAFGRVMQVGLVENVDTSAFAAGDVLYVSSTVAGILVATAPLYPNIRQELGTILVSDAAAGRVQVVARSMFNEGILDHGGMLGLTDDDHAQYLLLTGIRAMTGDFDLAGNDLKTSNVLITEYTASSLAVMNHAKTVFRSIYVYGINAGAFNSTYTNFYFDARNVAGGAVWFRTPNDANPNVAKMTAGYFELTRAGDITMLAGKSVDAYTNSGYIKLRRLSQSAEPTPEVGEGLLWRDTDDDKTYFVYEDPDLGGRKIELI